MAGVFTLNARYSGQRTDSRQLLEVVRERFRRTLRIKDGDRRIGKRHQREAHCHTVVVIGADLSKLELRGGVMRM